VAGNNGGVGVFSECVSYCAVGFCVEFFSNFFVGGYFSFGDLFAECVDLF